MGNTRIGLSVIFLIVFFLMGIRYFERQVVADNSWGLRTYTVPAQKADEIKNALNRLFWTEKDKPAAGNATVFSNGLLVVRAGEAMQSGVKELVDEMSKETITPTRKSIHVDYWIVIGERAKTSNAGSVPTLGKALTAIDQVDGPRKYRILEHLGSTFINDNNNTKIQGAIASMRIKASYLDNHLMLELGLNSDVGNVETDTEVKPGEFVVMGQNALKKDNTLIKVTAWQDPSEQPNVYHIIRAELIN